MRIDAEDAEKVVEYRKKIRHEFDPVYFNSRALIGKRLHIDKWLFDDIKIEWLDNLAAVKEKQFFFVSNHKSLADFLLQPYVLWDNHLPIPRIIAGANLNKFPFNNLWKKSGAISLDRKLKKKLYLVAFYEELKKGLMAGESLLDYAGGTRNRGEGIEKFQTGVIHVVLDVAKTGKDILAVPCFIDYDKVIEEDALKTVDKWKEKMDFYHGKGKNMKSKFYDYLCFYFDYLAYVPRIFSKDKGNAYLRFGKAFPIKDFDKLSLVEKLRQEIIDLSEYAKKP